MSSPSGLLIILSGPSGTGKTTLRRSVSQRQNCVYSVSCTTRLPREGEVHGTHYYFLSEEEFQHRVNQGDFLEHAIVHGNRYGTLKETVLDNLRGGRDMILDIDVQGAAQIRSITDPEINAARIDVFYCTPTLEILRERLISRQTETEEQVRTRLENAEAEVVEWKHYDYLLLSGSREEDIHALESILEVERKRTKRLDWTP